MTWAIFSDEHIRAIGEIIRDARSDRITAIVGGAMLDDTLRRTLSERLRNDRNIANQLFRVGGVLGNTGPKIDLLYMLGGFDKPTRKALHGLCEIRNFFAHRLDASFSTRSKKMVQAIKNLTLHRGKTYYPHAIYDEDSDVKIEDTETNRDRFIVNLKLCLIASMRDRVTHELWSNKPLTKTALLENKREEKRKERAKRKLERS